MTTTYRHTSSPLLPPGGRRRAPLTLVEALYLNLADVDARLDADAVRRRRDLAVGEEDGGAVDADGVRLEGDAEPVVLLARRLHRHVEAALVGQRDRHVTCASHRTPHASRTEHRTCRHRIRARLIDEIMCGVRLAMLII